jgi:hypothetical protein
MARKKAELEQTIAGHIPPPPPHVCELARKLIGTVGETDLIDEIEALTDLECKQLDIMAFECFKCGWWFARHERHDLPGGWACGECAA